MQFNITPDKYEKFKEYFANKLIDETGGIYNPEDIYIHHGYRFNYFAIDYYFLKTYDKFKYAFANVNFGEYKKLKITDLEFIAGNAVFTDSIVESLGSLKYICGSAVFDFSKVTDLGNLISISKNADFENSVVKSLGNLEYVGGDLNLKGSIVEDLGNLRYVEGTLTLNDEHKKLFADKVYYVKKEGWCFRNDPTYLNENDGKCND